MTGSRSYQRRTEPTDREDEHNKRRWCQANTSRQQIKQRWRAKEYQHEIVEPTEASHHNNNGRRDRRRQPSTSARCDLNDVYKTQKVGSDYCWMDRPEICQNRI